MTPYVPSRKANVTMEQAPVETDAEAAESHMDITTESDTSSRVMVLNL